MEARNSRKLFALGQSIWYDNINRMLLQDGTLKKYIDEGVIYGVTTNPSIFAKAIPEDVYDKDISERVLKGHSTKEIYDALTVEDVQTAADLFRDLYEATAFVDGYVSLEVSPELAHDTEGTVRDVKRLSAFVNRPNVMFKIPGTKEGVPAIRKLVAEGFNINVTLLFDVIQYEAIARAYIDGISEFITKGGDARKVASVASVFVSRIDSKVDKMVDQLGDEAAAIRGKAGVAIMKEVYSRFNELFSSEDWGVLKAHGARIQRVLWASTSTKDPLYSATKYVDSLVAPDTVNTVPPNTLEEAAKGESPCMALAYKPHFSELEQFKVLGIDLRKACNELQTEGVEKFAVSFREVLKVLDDKRKQLS
ncbi:MAG: transaldolase [Planctomycetota bacterium]|nr:transaldolase [Planctomycetota bacterium]